MLDRINRWTWLLVGVIISSCSHRYLSKQIHLAESEFKDHVGFALFDPVRGKWLFEHQSDRYFTPASNTKIVTLLASLKLLGDSIPALRHVTRGDSVIFWGTGDPSFLYGGTFNNFRTYDFLKKQQGRLFFSSANFFTDRFGPGWGWDDYPYYFQPERSSFPVYGNLALIRKNGDAFTAVPGNFQPVVVSSITKDRPELMRDPSSNTYTYFPGKSGARSEWKVPFHYNDELLTRLLADTLKREVQTVSMKLPAETSVLYSIPADSVYKVMMQASDNFIAEQLLMMCAQVVSDSLKPEVAISTVKGEFLADLPDKLSWVDGSGLSRYNLFTPRSVIHLWMKLDGLIPRERLFKIVAVGGESGTLKNYYKGEKPFIFGKTGTLSNNHSLSGFLVTKRGHTLIFSWMNNNFTASTGEIRGRMEAVLKWIYESY